MNAMILAAGRGERMRPLTDNCPKALLNVGGQTLLDWQLQRLAAARVQRVVINIAWLGEQIRAHLAANPPRDLEVVISDEKDQALETAGGIIQALPLLGSAPFWVVNADVWCDIDLTTLPAQPAGLGHLVLVDNPAHHPGGDFYWHGDQINASGRGVGLTYAGIGCFDPALFSHQRPGVAALAPILRAACERGELTATYHQGVWADIGTPDRLAWLNQQFAPSVTPPRSDR